MVTRAVNVIVGVVFHGTCIRSAEPTVRSLEIKKPCFTSAFGRFEHPCLAAYLVPYNAFGAFRRYPGVFRIHPVAHGGDEIRHGVAVDADREQLVTHSALDDKLCIGRSKGGGKLLNQTHRLS